MDPVAPSYPGSGRQVRAGTPARGGFRRRLFWILFLVALVPAALALALGTLVLREMVATTGSAGPWAAVAESGRELLGLVRASDPDPELARAADEHRAVLSESVRLSQVYNLLAERVALLTPVAGLFLLAVVAGVAALATGRLARSLAAPAEELAEWIRALGRGDPLPADPTRTGPEPAEFAALRAGLRDAEQRLADARRREAERIRERSWADMARRVAHEIKNPLTPMRMAAERVAGSTEPSSAESGRILLEEIGRLDALARSFSQFGRPPEGPPAPVELNELLTGLVRRVGSAGGPLDLELPTDPVVVQGHLEALERVVRNLVNNALEATRTGGGTTGTPRVSAPPPVTLRLDREGDEAVVVVEDRGPGIAPDLLERIWEPDFSTRRRGTGLGLPLVRQAVRSHGGSVRASNRPGGGARFEVRLPAEEA